MIGWMASSVFFAFFPAASVGDLVGKEAAKYWIGR